MIIVDTHKVMLDLGGALFVSREIYTLSTNII